MEYITITPELRQEIDDKITKLYEEKVGIQMGSKEIDRIGEEKDKASMARVKEFLARIFTFWIKTVKELLVGETDETRILAFKFVFENGKIEVSGLIKTLEMEEKDRLDVYHRASQLIDKDYTDNVYRTKRYLESTLERAQKYYDIMKKEIEEEGSNPILLPSIEPILWLLEQDKWIRVWTDFKDILQEAFGDASEEVRKETVDGCIAKYFDFMCKAFPEGYGGKVANITQDKFLMAEVLWKMRKKVREEEEKRKVLKRKLDKKLKSKRKH